MSASHLLGLQAPQQTPVFVYKSWRIPLPPAPLKKKIRSEKLKINYDKMQQYGTEGQIVISLLNIHQKLWSEFCQESSRTLEEL
jgi:hypothetical protein